MRRRCREAHISPPGSTGYSATMASGDTPSPPTGRRLLGAAVLELVMVGAAGIGVLQATSDGRWGAEFWAVVAVLALILALAVAAISVSNLARRRVQVASIAALLVVGSPLAVVALALV